MRFDEHVSFIAPAQEAWLGRDTVLEMELESTRCGVITEPKRAKRRTAPTSDPAENLASYVAS